jgi:hypothetical protein
LHFDSTKVLNLTVKKGRDGISKKLKNAKPPAPAVPSSTSVIKFADPVVYDFTPPIVYSVDDEGQVFSQVSSSAGGHSAYHSTPYVCTQESQYFQKGKEVSLEDSGDDAEAGCDYEDFDMGEEECAQMSESRRKEQEEIAAILEKMRKDKEDPLLHCEGDTDIEDIFVGDDEPAGDQAPDQAPDKANEPVPEDKKTRKLAVKRKGPTQRSHSSVVIDEGPDYKPTSDDDKCPGYMEFSDDDGFEPLSMILPKGRKSRAKKRPERKWYDEKRLQAHEQLCLKMCFRDVHQFRNALINLHIAQNRDYHYHRNSNVRIIVDCLKENCHFYMVASEIKNEKTFVIRKMRLEHSCETTNESTRVSAKWLAQTYEHLFRSDPNTCIQTIIDSARLQHGVEVPRMMAYRAKNFALDAVLGDHREQYYRLRDFAQTVVDTNPGSRVIVTTVTPAPSEENPHPGPNFHGLFFCVNGTREGFLNGCRPFIGNFPCDFSL